MKRTLLFVLAAALPIAACDSQDDYTGSYAAVIVCGDHDAHAEDTPLGPHVVRGGKFVIASYADGKDSEGKARRTAVIVDDGGFSEYDWSGLRLEYVPGRSYEGIELTCDDTDNNLFAGLSFDGNKVAAGQSQGYAAALEGLSYEHLYGRVDLHGTGKLHEVHVFPYMLDGEKQVYMTYGEKEDGSHAGHVHN